MALTNLAMSKGWLDGLYYCEGKWMNVADDDLICEVCSIVDACFDAVQDW